MNHIIASSHNNRNAFILSDIDTIYGEWELFCTRLIYLLDLLKVRWIFTESYGLIRNMYIVFIVAPLFNIYFNGPCFGGYGFWGGKSNHDICTVLAPSSSSLHWANEGSKHCDEMVMRAFNSFLNLIMTIVYFIVIYYAFKKAYRSAVYRTKTFTSQAYSGIQSIIAPSTIKTKTTYDLRMSQPKEIPIRRNSADGLSSPEKNGIGLIQGSPRRFSLPSE